MKKNIFRITVEVTHMEGGQLPDECAGAIVNVYCSASDIHNAIDLAESELRSDRYLPLQTISANLLERDDFDDEYQDEGDPSSDDLLKILTNGGIWYAAFHLYPPEERDIQ